MLHSCALETTALFHGFSAIRASRRFPGKPFTEKSHKAAG